MSATIGITGAIASGKAVVADYLNSKGFIHLSLSAEVRKEAAARELPESREVLQDVGDSLRKEFGNNILAKRVASEIEKMRTKGDCSDIVIDSLRNPAEIEWLKRQYGMIIIGIVADSEVRFNRVQKRGSDTDPKTIEDFDRIEKRDRGVEQNENGNRVDDCIALADVTIENNGTIAQLQKKLDEILESSFHSFPE